MPNVDVDPEAIKIFYEESKTARGELDKVRDAYRSNTTTVLALATGAATFFGFSDSPKGMFFTLALVAYGVAVLLAVVIYWPKSWTVNMASEMQGRLISDSSPAEHQARFDMAVNNQLACELNSAQISGRFGLAHMYSALLVMVGLVVVLAAVNTTATKGQDKPAVTKVEIVKGSN